MVNIRQFALLTIALLILFIGSQPAFAKTVEAKSENFIFIGDVREKDARELLTELEQYRSAILQLLGVNPESEQIPVRIYAAKNSKQLTKLTGLSGIGGVYRTTLDGPVFILSSEKGFRRGNRARHIALHEYTHHLLAAYQDNFYPRWYNEGLANYFATFEVNKNGGLVIGRPYNPYAYALSQRTWMPTSVVVNAIREYPFKSYSSSENVIGDSDYFYAQSWLAVHFFQSNKAESDKANKYIELLNSENRPKDLFNVAFGRSAEEFHKTMKAYYKKNKFNVMTIQPSFDIGSNPIKIRILDKTEAIFHRAEAMRFFEGQNVKPANITTEYVKFETKNGETARSIAAKAHLASREKEYEKAMSLMNNALALDNGNGDINRLAGIILIDKNKDADVPSTPEIKQARAHLKKALIANADDINAHFHYAISFQVLQDNPDKQAVASAKSSLFYYRSIEFVESNLSMAAVLLAADEKEEAKSTIDKAIVWGRGGAKMAAREMRKYSNRP